MRVVIFAHLREVEVNNLAQYGLTLQQLKTLYGRWRNGELSKNAIERDYLGNSSAHGKLISRLWRQHLGIETEKKHPLVVEVKRLRALLAKHGIDPDEEP